MSTTSTSSRKRKIEVHWDEIIPSLNLEQFQGEAEKKVLIRELTELCSTATHYSTLPAPLRKVICTSCGIEGWDETILKNVKVRGYSYLWHATSYVVQQCTYAFNMRSEGYSTWSVCLCVCQKRADINVAISLDNGLRDPCTAKPVAPETRLPGEGICAIGIYTPSVCFIMID